MPLLICYVLRFSTPCAEWDDLAILLAGAFSPKGDHGPLSAKALSGLQAWRYLAPALASTLE